MFTEKTINTQLPDHLSNPEIFGLVKIYQILAHSRPCWKQDKNEYCFSNDPNFSERTIIAKPLCRKVNSDEKQEKYSIEEIKIYIDNNLNPTKVNVIEPTKDNFTQPLTIKEILKFRNF